MSDRRKNIMASNRNVFPSSTFVKKRPLKLNQSSNQTLVSHRIQSAKPAKAKRDNTSSQDQDPILPEFEEVNRQISYGKFMRAMLEDCLVSEKIQQEESEMDIQMAELAARFQQTVDQLDRTNRRVKEITFVAEQKRLLDLKNADCVQLDKNIENTNAERIMKDLIAKEQASLDNLQTKNVDFGYDKNNGPQQLLDAVNDALAGFKDIKKHSQLDASKVQELEASQKILEDVEKERMDVESLRKDFEMKFSNFGKKLLMETSEKIAKMIGKSN